LSLSSVTYDFDMIAIGGGAAGLTAAGISAALGAKTALVEAEKLGGDCTWYGCVPSKTLLKAAKVAHSIRTADRYGLQASAPQFLFSDVMEHVHATQSRIYEEADAPPVLEKFGVEVVTARARFVDPHTIECMDRGGRSSRVTSRYFVVATGSMPKIPPIEGISSTDYLTNETVFSLSSLPRKLIVIGAGPIGIEMGQAFRRLGSEVVVLDFVDRILPRDDPELTAILQQRLASEGIQFLLGRRVERIEGTSGKRVTADGTVIEGDSVLLAAGRRAAIDGLDLDRAGVKLGKSGIAVDRHCRTSARHIYASGDVTGLFQFTHMAEHMSKVAVTNALLHLPVSLQTRNVIWCTYTDPELAHLGLTEQDLQARGRRFDTYRFPFTKIDRAVTEGETTGLIKVFARRLGKILGVSILGAQAGEMIGEYALALRHGVTLRQIAGTIHPYPTYGLGNRRAADQWYVRRQSPIFVKWLQRIFGYRGSLPDTSDPNRIV
jgi:pyruvate/2-oxoglutarate dehydrogenase complex dihydrolipoamide dehydrogenase (E3) component